MYTTHGYMTAEDYREYLKDTDQGATDFDIADAPEWFKAEGDCPVCGETLASHDAVRVSDASGEPFECWRRGAHAVLPAVEYPYGP